MQPTFQEYLDFVGETAIFPNDAGYAYIALGLGGETAELTEKLSRAAEPPPVEILKEVGDVFWYGTAMLRQADMIEYDGTPMVFTKPSGADRSLSEVVRLLVVLVGEIQEVVKKQIRTHGTVDSNMLFPKNQEKFELRNKIFNVFVLLRIISEHYGVTPMECIEMNMEKLRSRRARGVLNGSGDNR